MIFKHEYVDESTYIIRGSDGRVWDKTDELYLEFCENHTPGIISGNEFILVNGGIVSINSEKESILFQRAYQNVMKARKEAYEYESDPLFFKYQRDETTKQIWLDKVTEIKQRNPYPEGV